MTAIARMRLAFIILATVQCIRIAPTRRKLLLSTPGAVVALPAFAAADDDAALKEKLAERRKLMELSRSSNDRQRYFDLSRQRASVVYNTTYQGASCIPGLPCI